jgi:NAD(P)-dependent dehydrogenase (short-subunit alcohol dehydrogenase family)
VLVRGLDGKVIVVAGAATGIGAATARRLADEGVHVVVGDIAGDVAEKTAASIRAAGGSALAVRYDAVDEHSVRGLGAAAVAEFGGLDGWHNNAADTGATGTRQEMDTDALTVPLEVWDHSFEVNLRGYLYGVRTAVPLLLERGGGAMVHTASNGALVAMSVLTAYNATKAGVISLSRHVAERWGREGIRSNCVSPGPIRTEAFRASIDSESEMEYLLAQPNAPRIGEPEDLAAAVAFLMSADARWINGQNLSVDGGQVMR